MASQLKPLKERLNRYFRAYGGWSAILHSPLLWMSILIAAIGYGSWLTDNWSGITQSVIPNLLGFSLGTYAILFSLMTSRLKRALKSVKNDRGISYLDEINATFFHFIFVQVTALLWAFIYRGTVLYDFAVFASKKWPLVWSIFDIIRSFGGFTGYAMLVYSITLIIAAALAVYRLALIVDPSHD